MSEFRRASGKIKRKNIQIVVTEGLSEEIYLDRIRASCGNSDTHNECGWGDIVKLKKACSKAVSDREKRDMLAVVTDMDEKSIGDIEELWEWCDYNGIELYVSNPSFEVFLLMHYQDVRGAMSQSDLEDAIGNHLGRRYDKAKGIPLDKKSVTDAIDRAERTLPRNADPIKGVAETRGTTNFHKLLMKISERLKR